jgi:hypothetical protein
VLDQAWLALELTNIVSHKYPRKDGQLHRDHFQFVWKNYPESFRNKLLGLLERFDIVFPVKGKNPSG